MSAIYAPFLSIPRIFTHGSTCESSLNTSDPDRQRKFCALHQRYIIYFMLSFAVCYLHAVRSSVVLAVLHHNESVHLKNFCDLPVTCLGNYTDTFFHTVILAWKTSAQNLFVSSFYWGYIFTQFAAGYFADQYGGKHLLTFAILGASVCNLVAPFAIELGGHKYYNLFILRICNGLLQGPGFPAVNTILVYWTPKNARTTIVCFVYSATFLGTIFSLVLWVSLAEKGYPWTAAFYFLGAIGITWCLLWQVFCYSRPDLSPCIGYREKAYLEDDLDSQLATTRKVVPWRATFQSRPLWALALGHIASTSCFLVFVLRFSQYLEFVLRIGYDRQAYWMLIPFMSTWVGILVFGCLSDWMINEKRVEVTMYPDKKSAVLGCIIFFFFFYVAHCDRLLAVSNLAVAVCFMGVHYVHLSVIDLELAPNFTGIVTAICNGCGIVIGIVCILTLEIETTGDALSGWEQTFWLTMLVYSLGSVIFMAFGSGDEQYWNMIYVEGNR